MLSPVGANDLSLNLSRMTINDGDERTSCPLKAENYEMSRRVKRSSAVDRDKATVESGKCFQFSFYEKIFPRFSADAEFIFPAIPFLSSSANSSTI